MSVDVHIHSEVKIKGEWHHYQEIRGLQNYESFEKMAGVRGDVKEAIITPRGLPENLTLMTLLNYQYDQIDSFAPSWFGLEEIKQFADWYRKKFAGAQFPYSDFESGFLQGHYLFGNGYNDFKKYPKDYPHWLEDVRLIFWFK